MVFADFFFCPAFEIFQRIHFKIDIGEGANDYNVIAQREKLTELQIRVRQLLDKSEQIKREQDFQRVFFTIDTPVSMCSLYTSFV